MHTDGRNTPDPPLPLHVGASQSVCQGSNAQIPATCCAAGTHCVQDPFLNAADCCAAHPLLAMPIPGTTCLDCARSAMCPLLVMITAKAWVLSDATALKPP